MVYTVRVAVCRVEEPLLASGLHDPRVGYWEPAKFVAKLREHKTDNNMLIFKCDMGAGAHCIS